MFGKKKKNAPEPSAQDEPKTDGRIHAEGLGHVWLALTGINPATLIPQVIGTVLHEGGTRPPWQWKKKGMEYVLMAWPQNQPIRAAVLMGGPEGGQLKPITVTPLLEGLPNDLTVEQIEPRKEGCGGDVAVAMLEDKNPMWFFDPLFGRDESDLTPGVTHTFWLGAAALGIRKALLDEITLTQGTQFEAWAEDWLKNNPGRRSHEVPPLKIDIRGKSMIMPGRAFGEYQLRATIEKVEDWELEKMPVKALYLNFPFEDRPPLRIALFASKHVLRDYEPAAGQEVEAYAWFQGRIIDLEKPDDISNAQK